MELKNLDSKELKALKLDNGVKVIEITNKELMYYGVKSGFVITSINNMKISTVDDVVEMISNKSEEDVLRIEMLNLNGEKNVIFLDS